MTNFIPIFPLGIVAYPGEKLNLHIFEPRYRQLITDCIVLKRPFGIPTVLNEKVMEYGTLMEVQELKQTYDDGRMDITTRGIQVFRILETVHDLPEKLYHGAIVNYPPNDMQLLPPKVLWVANAIRELHKMLQVEKPFPHPDSELRSYDVAHFAGLNAAEEYELLQLLREDQRLEYLKRHLSKVMPVVKEMEVLKDRIKLNGHFRNLKSLGFDE